MMGENSIAAMANFGPNPVWRLSGAAAGTADIRYAAFGLAATDQLKTLSIVDVSVGFC